jgi:hypothetical protein
MSYLEFTHSQCFETVVRCHVHAFAAFNGVSREIYYDNLASAVAEHDGRLVRFHPRFLGFAREYNFIPRACNPASGWERNERPHAQWSIILASSNWHCGWISGVADIEIHRTAGAKRFSHFLASTVLDHCPLFVLRRVMPDAVAS